MTVSPIIVFANGIILVVLAFAVLLSRPTKAPPDVHLRPRARQWVRFLDKLNLVFGALTIVLAVLYFAGVPWAAVDGSPASVFTFTLVLACQLGMARLRLH